MIIPFLNVGFLRHYDTIQGTMLVAL
jgi:hypothetical protein